MFGGRSAAYPQADTPTTRQVFGTDYSREEMDIQEEFKKIDAHFDSISPETLVSDLIECGLGSIRDCTESGWDMVGAKNT